MVKNQSKRGLSWYVLLSITSTRHYCFPKNFFELFCRKRVCRVQAAHLHNAARALSNPSWCFQLSRQRFRFFDIVVEKQIECGLAWYIVLSTTIRVITVVKICFFDTVMTRIVVDKTIYHAKPKFDLFFTTISKKRNLCLDNSKHHWWQSYIFARLAVLGN